MITSIATLYKEKVSPALKEEFALQNINQVPRVSKIVVNIGTGRAKDDPKLKEVMGETLLLITGQKAAVRKARKAISSFKIREGEDVGLMVTLRGARMENFLEKLIRITLPRVRDFRGVNPKAFDGHGNYSLGLKEQGVFPEVPAEQIDKLHGLQITIMTTANNDKEGFSLLKKLGMPFSADSKKEVPEMTEKEDHASLLAHAKEKANKTKVKDAS